MGAALRPARARWHAIGSALLLCAMAAPSFAADSQVNASPPPVSLTPAEGGPGAARPSGGSETARYSPSQHLKNYALSACIAGGYQSSEVVNDATAAANGYKELGSLEIDAYNEALALIKKFLDRDYASASGEKLVLMKCIDLFHSKELDRLVQRYRKKRAANK